MASRRTGPPVTLLSVGDIIRLIESDPWMVDVLDAVRNFGPSNAWVGAGFVRNKVWDALHGYLRPSLLNDVDVIYFDPENQTVSAERAFEDALVEVMPLVPWSVRNQARMHKHFGTPRALSTLDAMRYWPETVTAIAVRKDPGSRIRFVSCYGEDDLIGLAVRPAPGISLPVYQQRMSEKDWRKIWPKLRVYGLS
ncbi:MAG: nucleotidyltransferase family protein [Rhodospirillaceae bacterium]|jgi:uncharacterized protein|nr:nucleotidyltransferase family protein [Rhodospirillaceae bacterium]MBT5666545.1 nucleotidyltransferase family protein [Rhodospirillaceae bacterium]MBT5811507.1 nucleotidyltransferase family protein [Rhodospirillaceae bacterium]